MWVRSWLFGLGPALILLIAAPEVYGQGLDPQQIMLIRDAASSTCKTVEDETQKRKKTDIELQGDVRAELSELFRKIANVGGSAAVKLNQNEFEGVTRDALATALEHQRDCRERLFTLMFTAIARSGTR
ncbi:MAG: hypothetical protein QOI05_354 [Bradyrhizobium sp.]|jgi:hypothetical protein|nr:hypothetical protein [Bradyrhizobium sp.]